MAAVASEQEEMVSFDGTLPRGETLGGTRAEELKVEAGEPVGEMPPAEPVVAPEPVAESIIVAGLKITPAALGGKKPQTGTITFTGLKADLMPGTFLEKGTVLKFSGEAVVDDVGQKDVRDKETRQVTEAVQRHSALVLDFQFEAVSE